MKAVLMAGGFGTRIQPLTINLPKPMIPLVNRPIMLHIIDLLKKHGPGNRLEVLGADRAGQRSIRVNDQWRICFRWRDGNAFDVIITDYH